MDAATRAIALSKKPPASAADARVQDGVPFDHGLLKSSGHGRTDTLPANVPAGAYVIPADVVSGLGQGNTLAGAKVLDRIFADLMRGKPPRPAPRVPVVVAGGEYLVHPNVVAELGGGNIKKGHELLDKYVVDVRKRTHETLKKLPGPVK